MEDKKPVIGIFPQYDEGIKSVKIREEYTRALKDAGAVPVMLPLYNEPEDIVPILDLFDGFLLSGGPDIAPVLFGEEPIPECGVINKYRDILELRLIPIIAMQKKPVLGICRGIQSINVALGGNLIQDISTQTKPEIRVAHNQKSDYDVLTHSVKIKSGSLLENIIGSEEILVNSYHHQAVKALGEGLTDTAWAKDGIIEAVELSGHPFFLGVQWHPEWLAESEETARKIFRAFVNACKDKSK